MKKNNQRVSLQIPFATRNNQFQISINSFYILKLQDFYLIKRRNKFFTAKRERLSSHPSRFCSDNTLQNQTFDVDKLTFEINHISVFHKKTDLPRKNIVLSRNTRV